MREQSEYVNKFFARMDLRQIREFLLYGTEDSSIETESYHVGLKQGSDPIYNRLIIWECLRDSHVNNPVDMVCRIKHSG